MSITMCQIPTKLLLLVFFLQSLIVNGETTVSGDDQEPDEDQLTSSSDFTTAISERLRELNTQLDRYKTGDDDDDSVANNRNTDTGDLEVSASSMAAKYMQPHQQQPIRRRKPKPQTSVRFLTMSASDLNGHRASSVMQNYGRGRNVGGRGSGQEMSSSSVASLPSSLDFINQLPLQEIAAQGKSPYNWFLCQSITKVDDGLSLCLGLLSKQLTM